MASFFLARLLSRRCMASAAATSSSSSPLHHTLSSLRHLHSSSSSASHASNPNPNPNPSLLPATLGRGSTVYPSFPYSAHLGPVSLSEVSSGGMIGVLSAPFTPAIPAIVRLELEKESEFGVSAAGFGNAGLVPLSEVLGLEIERYDDGDEDDEEIVIRADSVKKKRKRKMNKHKLRKLRKKLRRKT